MDGPHDPPAEIDDTIKLLILKLDCRHRHVDLALIPIVVNGWPPRPIAGAAQRKQHRIDEQREEKKKIFRSIKKPTQFNVVPPIKQIVDVRGRKLY